MISQLLNKLSVEFLKDEEGNRQAEHYRDIQKMPGWSVHQAILIAIGNGISEYMLSEKYTRLSPIEKDAQQRGFFATKEIIDFLINPLKGADKYAAIMKHNKKMEATPRRLRKSKEK